jgi:hypothetical protein
VSRRRLLIPLGLLALFVSCLYSGRLSAALYRGERAQLGSTPQVRMDTALIWHDSAKGDMVVARPRCRLVTGETTALTLHAPGSKESRSVELVPLAETPRGWLTEVRIRETKGVTTRRLLLVNHEPQVVALGCYDNQPVELYVNLVM